MFIDCKWVDTRWQWSFNMLHMHGLWRLIRACFVKSGVVHSFEMVDPVLMFF